MATATPASRAAKAFEAKIVHAYRRLPHLVGEPGKEVPVEVVAAGERIKFHSNDKGHIVATVTTPEAFARLVKEIPEAYIEYTGETPEKYIPPAPDRPVGNFVLTNGKESKVLDTMTDEELRAFALSAGVEAEALPEVLEGETLQRAIYNLLGGE